VATYRVPTSWSTAANSDPKERFVFHHAGLAGSGSSGYIDEVILRDRDNTSGWVGASDGTLEERFFHLHNWRHDVIALGKPDGTLVERVKYSAYGVATRLDPADYNQDGFIDFLDDDGFDADYTNTNALADFDYSGTVNATDSTTWTTAYLAGGITARGALSTTDAATGANNRSGYAGYTFSPATQQYHVRHRAYNPLVGAWGERDPLEYVDGSDLYTYVRDNPVNGWDPMGLRRELCQGIACDYTPMHKYLPWSPMDITSHPRAPRIILDPSCAGVVAPSQLSNPGIHDAIQDVRNSCLEQCPDGVVIRCTTSCDTYYTDGCTVTLSPGCKWSPGGSAPPVQDAIIIHELRHVAQNCKHGDFADATCDQMICRELDAYRTARQCPPVDPPPGSTALSCCERACQSVAAGTWCFRDIIGSAYSRCVARCRAIQGGCGPYGHYQPPPPPPPTPRLPNDNPRWNPRE
jgi:RHS repeat-associated protein